ncbi:MAG: endopeptidase La [Bacteroidota bacterium]
MQNSNILFNNDPLESTNDPVADQQTITAELRRAEDILPDELIVLPLLQRPIFPGLALPLTFSGKADLKAIRQAVEKEGGYIGLSLVKDAEEVEAENPDGVQQIDHDEVEMHEVGTVFQIMKVVPVAPEVVQVLGQGITRFKKKRAIKGGNYTKWEVDLYQEPKGKVSNDLKAYMMAISSELKELLKLNPLFKEQVNMVVAQLNYDAPGLTMDVIANLLTSGKEELQDLLETFELRERANKLIKMIKNEFEVAKIQKRIQDQINEKVSDQQKEFFLREQLKAIKKELGMEKEDGQSEVEKIEQKLAEKELSEEAMKVVKEELNKLRTINAQSPEFNVTRSYLELISDLPWGEYSDDTLDIKKARKILDSEHYGLSDVKDNILEFLASVIKRGKIAGSIICLVGPPGVGKTSIGKSVADALGRKFFRFSVGGMRDEAEIKGHRRTYIGAMPGKIIQALKRVEVSNPVIMLDEIDKIGSSFRGDPASALLEVLDPEQNTTFLDHYLDIPFDLSNVLFITTANQLETIPAPLLDRMEIIRLSGYILQEKVEIAKQYLVPKQLKEHGFEENEMTFTDEALSLIVDKYAREAGVRNLEKQIRRIIRKVNLKIAEAEEIKFEVDAEDVREFLGKPIFRTEKLYNSQIPGVALGLAYTSMGGATLYIEATGIPSKNASFKQTGQLGDVMKESAQIAYSYIRAKVKELHPDNDYFENHAIHLHVPAGATPKDGPSAGITMALALYSLATGKAIKDNLAMTGELTLTGKVLPIGGVREKTIAGRRVEANTLIFPADNQRDFEELPEYIQEGIAVNYADYFDDVLRVAF